MAATGFCTPATCFASNRLSGRSGALLSGGFSLKRHKVWTELCFNSGEKRNLKRREEKRRPGLGYTGGVCVSVEGGGVTVLPFRARLVPALHGDLAEYHLLSAHRPFSCCHGDR